MMVELLFKNALLCEEAIQGLVHNAGTVGLFYLLQRLMKPLGER